MRCRDCAGWGRSRCSVAPERRSVHEPDAHQRELRTGYGGHYGRISLRGRQGATTTALTTEYQRTTGNNKNKREQEQARTRRTRRGTTRRTATANSPQRHRGHRERLKVFSVPSVPLWCSCSCCFLFLLLLFLLLSFAS